MKNIFLALLFISTSLWSQDFEKNWNKVIEYENAGKIKSANAVVESIYNKAVKNANEVQIIKCFFYKSKYIQTLEENAQNKILINLKSEIGKASIPSKALLTLTYAKCLQEFLGRSGYSLYQRKKLDPELRKDFLTWASDDFENEIKKAYASTLENEAVLKNTPLKNYEPVFDYLILDQFNKLTLYDYLINENILFLSINASASYESTKEFSKDKLSYLGNSEDFLSLNLSFIENVNLKKALEFFQMRESRSNDLNYVFERIKFCYHKLNFKNDDYLYALNQLQKNNPDTILLQKILYEKAYTFNYYADKINNSDHKIKASKLIDSILLFKNNSNAVLDALKLKNQIESKGVSIVLEKFIYQNQYSRALVTYRNINQVKISFFRISQKETEIFKNRKTNKDSLKTAIANRDPLAKSTLYSLIDKKDYFGYTTEILLPQLDLGSYMVCLESVGEKKVFSYEIITVTNFAVLSELKKDTEFYYVSNRKTGKPIENAIVKSKNFSIKTNKNGVAQYVRGKEKKSNYNNEPIQITSSNDSIAIDSFYLYNNNDEKDKSIARIKFYLDRAIYRPGQTVYYKGIVIQNINGENKVVPNLLVTVKVENFEDDEIKSFDVTTNEFGSFSGEFILPKNGLTGNYTISAEEPEEITKDPAYDTIKKQHPFWDTIDFENSESRFKVEEYKRPKFEIVFDPIKESFVLNDTISVTGLAKSYTGSAVSEAIVKYRISGYNYYETDSYIPNRDESSEEGTTKTDAAGKFVIKFASKAANNLTLEKRPAYFYTIQADITDINGETMTQEIEVKAGFHNLGIYAFVPDVIKLSDKTVITVRTTNLNDVFKPAKGEAKIYFIRAFNNKFKNRTNSPPEINSISKEDFEKLFPYENYENYDDATNQGTLVKTLSFDTKISPKVTLDLTSTDKSGFYRIIFSSIDDYQNKIEDIHYFSFKNEEFLQNQEGIINIQQLNEDAKKDGFVSLKITSPIPDLYILANGAYKSKKIYDAALQLKNNEKIIKIPIEKEFINSVSFGFDIIYENQHFQQSFKTELKEQILPKLIIETETFRNKIEPGTLESWSFKLSQENKYGEAEMLATMYDASLDQFYIQDWENLRFNQYHNNSTSYKTKIGFENTHLSLSNLNSLLELPEKQNEDTKLVWFGFNFNNLQSQHINSEYRKILSKKAKKPKNAKLVYGSVIDANGPLPGVNVVVKGTQRGVSTNFDGTYEIEAAEGESLVFSFMGLNDVIKTVGAENVINTVMQEDSRVLEAVVVTAVGIKKRSDAVTSSFQRIKSSELSQEADVAYSLAGKVSGLQINSTGDGFAFNTNKVVLRGVRSMSGDKEALIVIDGVISSSSALKLLTSDDMLSAQVIKGTEGAALYGSDGINGVIIITTKKAIQELIQVKARKNLSETAFFFPHLKTDKSGKVSFNFTSPEALTQWKLRLFAHNKNMVSGYLQEKVITQKDLMVTPNFPRFLREKDSIQIVTKVANVTGTAKTGIAVLQFFDATTMESIDQKMMNADNIKNFNIPAFGNTTVSWKIYVPEGLQGVQYKVLAKSGTFSDGEENILPVLTNNILVTESIPIWVRENSKKEYTFENLKNNNSSTLRNHQFTFEYTSNPTWLAIQSLPYLMEYEHECAEQTFARFYANTLASEIINSNPKIASVFENWKKNGKLDSKLEQNEELKSVLLAETPWILDAQNEEEKKKNLALLFDLDKMKNSQDATFNKLKQKQNSSGGFAWFDGGSESEYITRHILAGLGHLEKLNTNEDTEDKIDEIVEKGIPFMDTKFLESHKRRTENLKDKNKTIWLNPYSDLHYLYSRSFYLKNYPLSESLKKATLVYIENIKANWLTYSLYEKGMASLVLKRFGDTITAKKIIESLKETSANNEDWGMYWIANKSGWYWYEAPIETQALLIEAFAEVNQDTKSVDAMKVWLLKNKQTKNWPTTKSTTEAVYALLIQGTDWLSVKDNTVIKIGDQKIVTKKMSENEKEAETGYLKLTWKKDEIKKEMASITVENKSKVPGFGGVYWQYFEDLDKIKTNSDGALSVSKELYIKKNNGKEDELKKITTANPLKIGDLVTVRLTITSKEDLEFIHLKDMRASCFEPIDVLSKYKYEGNLGFYMSTKDTATHLFFDQINKGTYVLEYDIRVNNIGDFSNGITTIQSMYAPEYTSHTKGIRVSAKE